MKLLSWLKRRGPDERLESVKRKAVATIRDLQATIEARDRKIRVLEVEIESLAEVIARDRQRVLAEAAQFARQRAENEVQHGRADQSVQ